MIVETFEPGSPGYTDLLDALCAEPLRTQWWHDAESAVEPGTTYVVAYGSGDNNLFGMAAWAGLRISDGVVRCCDNYVRRGFRGRGFYESVYWVRHQILAGFGMPGETFLFPEPILLHEAGGWVRDARPAGSGVSTVTGVPHRWQRLTWTPRP